MTTDPTAWSFETKQIHAGQSADTATGARALPIYQTTSYVFRDTDHAAALFGLAEPGNIYTRIMNPTQDAVEQRIAALEGGVGALLRRQRSGGRDVRDPQPRSRPATTSCRQRRSTAARTTSSTTRCPSWASRSRSSTTPTTWTPGVPLRARTPRPSSVRRSPTREPTSSTSRASPAVAHEIGVPLIVDNTVATPYLIQPLKHGADIVVHSATKYLGGHGTAVAGVIVDGGTFDWAANAERFPEFSEPDPSYHGLVYTEALGNLAYIIKARIQLLRDLGSAVAPFNAFLIAQGLETLSLRIERHVQNAKAIAEWLEQHPQVESVNYSGLPSSPWYERGQKYAPNGTGAVLSFEIVGGLEAGKRFVDSLELFSHVANIGDVRSLVIAPASTTHSQLTAEEQAASGVTPGLVRLAVGLEGLPDLIADLEAGFRAAKGA